MLHHHPGTWLISVAMILLGHATPVFGIRADAAPIQQAELTASDGTSGDDFGISVAISGSTAVVGAPYRNGNTGAAYVFVRSGETWSQQAELTASDGASGDWFGSSVAISGSTIVMGAPGKNVSTGVAYVFVGSGATWSEQAELTPSPIAAIFGVSVAISGSTVVVGSPSYLGIPGTAFVFVRSGTTWSQRAELTAPSGGTVGDHFGASVAISGPITVVGADGEKSETGAAYVFVRSGGFGPGHQSSQLPTRLAIASSVPR